MKVARVFLFVKRYSDPRSGEGSRSKAGIYLQRSESKAS